MSAALFSNNLYLQKKHQLRQKVREKRFYFCFVFLQLHMNFLKQGVLDLLEDDGLLVLSRECGYREVHACLQNYSIVNSAIYKVLCQKV